MIALGIFIHCGVSPREQHETKCGPNSPNATLWRRYDLHVPRNLQSLKPKDSVANYCVQMRNVAWYMRDF